MEDWLHEGASYLGLKPKLLATGVMGATVLILRTKGVTVGRGVVLIVSGAAVANYVTPLISAVFPSLKDVELGIGFCFGMTALSLLDGILAHIGWTTKNPGFFWQWWSGRKKE